MKIVKQSARWEQEPPKDILQIIERAGRTCYKSEKKITAVSANEFVRSLLSRGHDSVLEHVSLSVRVVTDRGVSHEIVRHRIGMSYSQESTRYCRYQDSILVVEPPGLIDHKGTRDEWLSCIKGCEGTYVVMLARGISPQIARSVLPTCLKTELVITGNIRSWRHFFRLRLAAGAHPQMRELAGLIWDLFRAKVPVLFDDFLGRKIVCH